MANKRKNTQKQNINIDNDTLISFIRSVMRYTEDKGFIQPKRNNFDGKIKINLSKGFSIHIMGNELAEKNTLTLKEIPNILDYLQKTVGQSSFHWKYGGKKPSFKKVEDYALFIFLKYYDLQKYMEKLLKNMDSPEEATRRLFCVSEKGIGFIKFGKFGEKIEIGRETSQPYRLLQCLTEPFKKPKSIDTVFETIREGLYKKSKNGIYTSIMDKPKKVKLIEYAIKEVQKVQALQGKLKFEWDEYKNKLWLEQLL